MSSEYIGKRENEKETVMSEWVNEERINKRVRGSDSC